MGSSIELDGWDRVQRVLVRGGAAGVAAAGQAVFEEAQLVFADSQVLTPVDTGALRSSGQVKPPMVDGDGVVVEITYGGAAAPYALYVHEDPEARHASPTSAKFLEIPVLTHVDDMTQRIADRIERLMQGGV